MATRPTIRPARKRQFGAEKRTDPLPALHARPSDRTLAVGRLAILATVLFWLLYVIHTIVRQFINDGGQLGFRFTVEAFSYVVVVTFLTFSALMYLVARQGALQRFRSHVRVVRSELDRHFAGHEGGMTVLVPSYAEEPDVVRKTLWSAALQEYPGMRVVLLLDDPPHPKDPDAAAQLARSREITRGIQDDLAAPASRFGGALLLFELSYEERQLPDDAVRETASHYEWAADWLETQAAAETVDDHVDEFFVSQVLLGLATDLRVVAHALFRAASEGAEIAPERLLDLHRRLARIFDARLETFERKQFASLSHEANKAMNLNAYIGLMGGRYRVEATPTGDVLRTAADGESSDLDVPWTEYLLTLDADSLLLRDYCLRLVYFLEQPGHERVAVTQTPYSSFRGAPTRLERLAGATTDLQHILHQGKSHYGATFWVGANAVIRRAALDDIVEVETEGGFTVKRYVQDRTVIEDTESSVDLGERGWTLMNYPERLSYSATPPDFGSLVVQRRRWANGGLLIMPKLWRQVRERRSRGERVGWSELALRVNYMSSIAWASFGLVFLLAYPYDSRLLSPVVVLAALPYFLAMAADLKALGYKRTDVLRIYGFNLILLPVQLAGVLKSIEQMITGKKIPFARTPKVRDRTSAPLLYVVAPLAIVAFSVLTLWRDVSVDNWGNAAFAAFNAVLALSAIVAYIGIGASIVDIWLGLTRWLYVERTESTATPASTVDALDDWRVTLHEGDVAARMVAPSDVRLSRTDRSHAA